MNLDDESLQQLFPLRLTSMEKFHWFDCSPQFINLVHGRFRFKGKVDPVAAERATQLVIRRHPLLAATVVSRKNDLFWEWSPDKFQPINWTSKLDDSPGRRLIDLANEPPWHIESRTDGKETEISFHGNHAVFDGLAGVQFCGDWMKFYHNIVVGNGIYQGFRQLNADHLRNRGQLGLLKKSYLKKIWKQPVGIFGAIKFLYRKPVEFRPQKQGIGDWDYQLQPCVTGKWLDAGVGRLLKQVSQRMKVSVNSLLIGELFKTLEAALGKNQEQDSRWIRIFLPMSIRTFADRTMPATNRATVIQLDRRQIEESPFNLYQGINYETGIIRNWDLGKLFLITIRGASLVPGMLKRFAKSDKCRGTAVFANLAEAFGRLGLPVVENELQVGNMKLAEFDFVGPIRNRTPINFTIQQYVGRYRVSLHSDPRVLSAVEADAILSDYCRAIEKLAES